jgi:3D (Asp-Asp-Asp) domain-containing protein
MTFAARAIRESAFIATAYIAVAHATSPFISVYPWSGGFGTKYSDPATLPAGTGLGVAFSPSGADIAVAQETSTTIIY